MSAVEVVFVPLLILGLFIVLDVNINRSCERARIEKEEADG
jgi:hypothetical protein